MKLQDHRDDGQHNQQNAQENRTATHLCFVHYALLYSSSK